MAEREKLVGQWSLGITTAVPIIGSVCLGGGVKFVRLTTT